jgi:hypothetical protein
MLSELGKRVARVVPRYRSGRRPSASTQDSETTVTLHNAAVSPLMRVHALGRPHRSSAAPFRRRSNLARSASLRVSGKAARRLRLRLCYAQGWQGPKRRLVVDLCQQ